MLSALGIILAGQLSYTLHILLTPHGFDAHGTLVHVEHSEGATEVENETLPSDTTAKSVVPNLSENDECQTHATSATPSTDIGPPLVAKLLQWELLSWPNVPTRDKQPVALLALAPKQSPPRS